MLDVLYEDNHILVCIKPVGVLSQADATGDADMLTLIADYLRKKYQKPGNVFVGLVHRLDRMVGGVMVFAKTSKAASRLSEQVRNHTFRKTYRAVVGGVPSAPSGTFQDYLLKNEKTNMVSVVPKGTSGAKEAVLDYHVLSQCTVDAVGARGGQSLSLVEVNLRTGRPHQIRVQFASRKMPLLGDHRYGKPMQGLPAIPSVGLWSYSVEIMHPTKKEPMVFEKEPPMDVLPWKLLR